MKRIQLNIQFKTDLFESLADFLSLNLNMDFSKNQMVNWCDFQLNVLGIEKKGLEEETGFSL